jgi:predicted GNAT family N-acyltransferase
MNPLSFKFVSSEFITVSIAQELVLMLKEQGKVQNPNKQRVKQCKLIGIATYGQRIVGIGAIKRKTNSVFGSLKANKPELANHFDWELGYCFTKEEHRGKGISSSLVKKLLNKVDDINLMATTELHPKNSMVHILEKNGFNQIGKSWKSSIHDGQLGLFIKTQTGTS